jgi:hypothetical protein
MKHNFKPYLNPIFIETGSYTGDGIIAALHAGFKTIYSIELSEFYYNLCVQRYGNIKGVNLVYGDSSKVLSEILQKVDQRCTFWLDAHFNGDPKAAKSEKLVPLWEELQIIANHPIKNHTIIIDDIRLLRRHEAEWKDLSYCVCDVEELINAINPNYIITYDKGEEKQDILIARV